MSRTFPLKIDSSSPLYNPDFDPIFLRVALKKSGLKTPRIELIEMGPSIDFLVRRTRLASDDLYKEACRQPKASKVNFSQHAQLCSILASYPRIGF